MIKHKVNFKITVEGTCDADDYAIPMELYDLHKSLVDYSKENTSATVNMETKYSEVIGDKDTLKTEKVSPININIDEKNINLIAEDVYRGIIQRIDKEIRHRMYVMHLSWLNQ